MQHVWSTCMYRRMADRCTAAAAAETRRTFSRPMGCAGSTPATKETGGSSGKSPRSRSPISSLFRAIRAVRIGGLPWGNLGSWASRFIGPSARHDLGRGSGGTMRYLLGSSELRPIVRSEGISAWVELCLATVELLGPSWVR